VRHAEHELEIEEQPLGLHAQPERLHLLPHAVHAALRLDPQLGELMEQHELLREPYPSPQLRLVAVKQRLELPRWTLPGLAHLFPAHELAHQGAKPKESEQLRVAEVRRELDDRRAQSFLGDRLDRARRVHLRDDLVQASENGIRPLLRHPLAVGDQPLDPAPCGGRTARLERLGRATFEHSDCAEDRHQEDTEDGRADRPYLPPESKTIPYPRLASIRAPARQVIGRIGGGRSHGSRSACGTSPPQTSASGGHGNTRILHGAIP
jgi:hypothetical protein